MASNNENGELSDQVMYEAYKAMLLRQILEERAYHYASLKNPTSFRIFCLDPAPPESESLHGSLVEADLDAKPHYECLSYVWGTGEKDAMIGIDQSILQITSSLRSALLRLRHNDRIRHLWIDQICIDQTNLEERSQQVQQMAGIYEQAHSDLMWLGEEDRNSRIAFAWVKESVKASMSAARPRDVADQRAFSTLVGTDTLSMEEWTALTEIFLSRPIWHRIWIVQEIVLSQRIILVCGQDTLNWWYIELISQSDQFKVSNTMGTSLNAILSRAFSKVMFFNNWRKSIRHPTRPSLRDSLIMFQEWNATDERDKVYALLGLTMDIGIKPDYRKSIRTVFIEIATAIIEDSQNLNFICNDQVQKLGSDAIELPSWVPYIGKRFAPLDAPTGDPDFNASRYDPSRKYDKSKNRSFRISGDVLTAAGYCLDYIESINAISDDNMWSTPAWHLQIFNSIPKEAIPKDGSMSSIAQWDKIWRSLLHDRSANMVRLKDEEITRYRAQFLDWYHTVQTNQQLQNTTPASGFIKSLQTMNAVKRNLGITKRHKLLVSIDEKAKVGDGIYILDTASVPLILRQKEAVAGDFKLIGTAYVHGYMDGEAMEENIAEPAQNYRLV